MSTFLENARQIFDAAQAAMRAGQTPSDLTILINEEGHIEVLAESDWPLDRLLADRGARIAYRVRAERRGGGICLEGRSISEYCRLETADRAREALRGPCATPDRRPSETLPILPEG
ncbi:MAG TPA: hypothetical protein PLA43_06265 [Bryobacteraceae bacterium]|nr:hypothetical protein [Bryobacteraceae bacterium]HOL73948.1 hypothetical protein [Bryobacteraceae bacterium]HOQ45731.1 hypothetical protein [Bryobacteraceae bacterium]HPQ15517.1 hypothetical protein [Bryobacteraceae bacterium]HPU71542.1 hypothetical protein [Bryobacteraceae bacterium]